MKRALLFILWFWCGVPALLLGQGYSKLTVDFVETNRRCRDDAAVVRRCNVAYGHYTLPSEWGGDHPTHPSTRRFVLLCQSSDQELRRKDCFPLEGGQSYGWDYAHRSGRSDDGYWYELYGDFQVVVVVRTPTGNATYTMKTLLPEHPMTSGNIWMKGD